MSELAPIPLSSSGVIASERAQLAPGRGVSHDAAPARRGEDHVEVSPMATYLAKLRQLPIRQDLVDSIRRQIENGTYDTPEKFDAALSELERDLD